jgi:hypothetical protein
MVTIASSSIHLHPLHPPSLELELTNFFNFFRSWRFHVHRPRAPKAHKMKLSSKRKELVFYFDSTSLIVYDNL